MDIEIPTLYVCKNNVGRSQMAMEYHNQIHPGEAFSAGTHVDMPGGKVIDWLGGPELIIAAGIEEGINIAGNNRTQLNEHALRGMSRVVFLNPESMYEYLDAQEIDPGFPECTTIWPIEDPHHMSVKEVRVVNAQIKDLVGSLAMSSCTKTKPVLS